MNVLALLLIILSGIIIFFYYRITNPPINNNLKFVLGLIRFFFFAIVIMLIFNPTLHFSRTKKISPITIVMIDSSASMLQPLNSTETKSQAALHWEQELNTYFKEHSINNKIVPFSNGLQQDSTTTDIFLALKELQDNPKYPNISDVILISDGLQHSNNSYSLIDELHFPVFPVILGKDTKMTDVSLDEVTVNNPLYLNMETEVSCCISGLPDSVTFLLSIRDENDRLLEEKLISNNNEKQFSLSFTPSKLGYQKLSADVELQDTPENILGNNRREFLVSVVKNKAQFTLISSSLNWDITFIHRALMKNERFETSLLVQRRDGYFQDNELVSPTEKLSKTDILILHNSETFNFDKATLEAVENFVSRGGNILYIGKIDPELSGILPLQTTRFRETIQTTVIPTKIMGNYQTFLVNRDKDIASFWNALPPVTTYFYERKPNTEVILQADIVSENPIIAFSPYLKGHILQWSGYDFFKWKMWEKPDEPWFDSFIMNIAQWLLNADISQRFLCSPDKIYYLEGEPVEFTAYLFDEKMNLVNGQNIKLHIIQDDSLVAEKFLSEKDNSYKTEIDDLKSGKYIYSSETELGKNIFKDDGQFLIEILTLEQSSRGIQEAYLKYIASKTNGEMLSSSDDFKEILRVQREPIIIRTTRDIELWKKWYLAVIAIVLIGTELFIRKKKGLL
ncbi:MAG: hypothetical protein J7M10_03390 [Candidatus Cloacimonetes bacterium]|nr:hypothetical protein [Candidatus Cloacimonadota bacterium]